MNTSKWTFFLLALFLPFFSIAQGWEKTYDGGLDETYAKAADRTLDGGLILAGSEYDNTNDLYYSYLHKTDKDGNLQWEFRDSLHSASFVNTLTVHASTDGNFLLSSLYGNNPPNNDFALQKIAPGGNILWSKSADLSPFLDYVWRIKETATGDYLLMGIYENSFNINSVGLVKIDANGALIWEKGFSFNDLPMFTGDIISSANGDIILSGYYGFSNLDQDVFLKKLDANGTIIWEKEYSKASAEFAIKLIELTNGEIIIGGQSQSDFAPAYASLHKVDADGNELWYQIYDAFGDQIFTGLEKTNDGGFVLAGYKNNPNPSEKDFYLMRVDETGQILWTNTYGRSRIEFCVELLPADDKGFYLYGSTQKANDFYDAYLVKTDSLGQSLTNELAGNLYNDENLNCLADSGESGLSQWLIEAQKGDIHYLDLTDSSGNYSFTLDTGIYEINVTPISPYWDLCDSSFTVDFTTFNQTISQDIPAQILVSCPLLDVSIGTPFLRRCFENIYTVNYCNYGTTIAEDAYAEITLDPDMIFLGSSLTPSAQNGLTYTFDLGDVEVGSCGSFSIDVLLGDATTCDSIALGATHCVVAHIYPDSICIPTPGWSGASVEVDATCSGDSIAFLLENVGTASTQSDLRYIIVEDDVILFSGTYDLDPGEKETMTFPTNGATFRLEAEQEPNHPGNDMPSVSIEGCGDINTIFNFGFVNIFSQNDSDPFIDIDCRQNVGSYDPNDKKGFPLGYGDENFISKGQDIEYLIRFQNTGTDTAFTVRIEDQLVEELDISTVRPGASSHDYDFDINRDGKLIFTFNNIMLPDSNVNEARSHGFVKFKVVQQTDLALGTKIYNSADIYFDFNAPIITNRTLHTLGEPLINITVSIDPVENEVAKLEVYPNPFNNATNFEIQGEEIDRAVLKLYDTRGALLRKQTISQNIFIFEQKELSSGMYFFTIEGQGGLIISGKIMIR